MAITTTSAGSTELLKVVETGEDTEVKTEKMYVEENPFTIKSKTVEAQALIQIQVLILAPRMTNKSVAKNRFSLKR